MRHAFRLPARQETAARRKRFHNSSKLAILRAARSSGITNSRKKAILCGLRAATTLTGPIAWDLAGNLNFAGKRFASAMLIATLNPSPTCEWGAGSLVLFARYLHAVEAIKLVTQAIRTTPTSRK